jgi:hypothetical protein
MTKHITIVKSSGQNVPFSEEKLKKSLKKAGADEETADYIIEKIQKEIYNGISTKKIYNQAFQFLKSKSLRPVGARYKLKQAILELGPSGFPFEKYIGQILKHKGYDVKVGVIVQGHCVKHEVDVIAENDERIIFIECKFHKNNSYRCDVKIPLYINSRFLDIEKNSKKQERYSEKKHEGWVVTNTKFTTDAIQYGNCSGLNLLAWDYPEKGGIRKLVDDSGLYPLTVLTTLNTKDKQLLLDKKIVLCQEILENPHLLTEIGLLTNKIKEIIDECNKLCHIKAKIY